MYIFVEYIGCLILAAFAATLLFTACALWVSLSEAVAGIRKRLARGLTHEAREFVRRQTRRSFCGRVRSGFRRVCGWGLNKDVAAFQMVKEEPPRPVTPSTGWRSGLAPRVTLRDPRD